MVPRGEKIKLSLLTKAPYLLLLLPVVRSAAKAGFIDNFPRNLDNGSPVYYEDYTVHDSDIKIPGRHYPKKPYLNRFPDYVGSGSSFDGSTDYRDVTFSTYGDIKDLPQGDGLKPPTGPRFDRNLTRNVTVQAGKVAMLSCKVNEISQKSVSWIRLRDLHILTVDKYKYSTDKRVTVEYNVSNSEWILRIAGAKHSDAGKYECQVSTKPVLSFIVNLDVVDELVEASTTASYPPSNNQQLSLFRRKKSDVPKAYIVNSPDIHVHLGSLINLTCVVNHGKNQPVYIYWYHQNKLVDIGNGRRNVEMIKTSQGQTVSQLIVRRARIVDSGTYACKPSNGDAERVTLHVLKGELQAAMQTNSATRKARNWNPIMCLIAALSIVL